MKLRISDSLELPLNAQTQRIAILRPDRTLAAAAVLFPR